jgi:hypothetical protein
MPGKGARSGGLNIPYDSTERVEQFLFFFLAAAPSRGARKIVESHKTLERGRNWTQKSPPRERFALRDGSTHTLLQRQGGHRTFRSNQTHEVFRRREERNRETQLRVLAYFNP